jgi:hypothetical protein
VAFSVVWPALVRDEVGFSLCRLAKQGIMLSERQVGAFLAPNAVNKIDFAAFSTLSRPRAVVPTSKPEYIRDVTFSADGQANTVGYSSTVRYATSELSAS